MQEGQQCTNMTELLAALFVRLKTNVCKRVCLWGEEKECQLLP